MFKTLCCLSKLKPTPLRPMACRYCSPSYRNLCWVSVYTWDVTSDHSDPNWSADHGWPDGQPFSDPRYFRSTSQHYPMMCRGTDQGPVSERVAINRKFYMICHWAAIDIHSGVNPFWGVGGDDRNLALRFFARACTLHHTHTHTHMRHTHTPIMAHTHKRARARTHGTHTHIHTRMRWFSGNRIFGSETGDMNYTPLSRCVFIRCPQKHCNK